MLGKTCEHNVTPPFNYKRIILAKFWAKLVDSLIGFNNLQSNRMHISSCFFNISLIAFHKRHDQNGAKHGTFLASPDKVADGNSPEKPKL